MSPVRDKQDFGLTVPDFSLPLIGGDRPKSLGDTLAGKKGAVVIFWSGVCSHCVRYDAYFNHFAHKHPDIGVVMIASRHGESAEMIRKTVAERKLNFDILHDPPGAVARAYYAQQTPRCYLIDADRKLLYRGAVDNFKYPDDSEFVAYLDPAIDEFLGGKPVSRADTPSFGCAIMSVYYVLPKPLA